MAEENNEQRSEFRLTDEAMVFIETYASPAGEDLPCNNIVISKTVDLSANGLQVIMDKPLPLHSLLQLCVEISGLDRRFHLAGEVVWLAETSEPRRYLIGFKLLESEQTNIADWKAYICDRLSEELENPDD